MNRKCDINIEDEREKQLKEYFNEYGYNLGITKKEINHLNDYKIIK